MFYGTIPFDPRRRRMSVHPVRMVSMASQIATNTSGDDVPNPDTLPTSGDPTGVCPRCHRHSNFTNVGFLPLVHSGDESPPRERVVALRCQGCSAATAVIEVKGKGQARFDVKRNAVHWWPVSGAIVDMTDVPLALAEAFEEGVRCISVEAPHASVAMFRNALAHIVHDKGSEAARKKNTLNAAIQQMVADKTLFDAFDKWATRVRTVGNAGAHQESWENIPISQARELQDLVRQLIDFLYIQPAKFNKMMPPVKRPKPSTP